MKNQMVVKEYLGRGISFKVEDGAVYANATEMCKVFGKLPADWLRLKATKEYVEVLESDMGNHISVIETIRGGESNLQGTWIHEKLVLDLARWLNVKFRVWCDDKIAELLREGSVSIEPKVPKSYAQALLEAGRLALELEKAQPKVEYYDKVLDTTGTLTTTQIAKELEMSATKLNKCLEKLKVQYKQSGQWMLYAEHQDKGYMKTKTSVYRDEKKGEDKTSHYSVWTEKGKEFVISMMEDFI